MNIDHALNIDRPMVSLFFEIKRNMPFDQRKDMKIAAPNIGEQLVSIYRDSNNKSLKGLIENFMEHAGQGWAQRLNAPKKSKLLFYRNPASTQPNAIV